MSNSNSRNLFLANLHFSLHSGCFSWKWINSFYCTVCNSKLMGFVHSFLIRQGLCFSWNNIAFKCIISSSSFKHFFLHTRFLFDWKPVKACLRLFSLFYGTPYSSGSVQVFLSNLMGHPVERVMGFVYWNYYTFMSIF